MQADGILGDHVLLSPPYTITEEEVCFLVDVLRQAIETILPITK